MAGKIAYGMETIFQKENNGDKMSKIAKFKELLVDLEELKEIDGYTIYQSEANDKDYYVATDCFYEYKELAEKYDIDYKSYDVDEDSEKNEDKFEYKYWIWDCVGSISWEIEKKIKGYMMELVGPEEEL